MSADRGMDKESVVHIYNEILLSRKKEQNNTICSDMMDLNIIIRSEVIPRKKYGITHMWNLIKNDTNKHIYLFICEKQPHRL